MLFIIHIQVTVHAVSSCFMFTFHQVFLSPTSWESFGRKSQIGLHPTDDDTQRRSVLQRQALTHVSATSGEAGSKSFAARLSGIDEAHAHRKTLGKTTMRIGRVESWSKIAGHCRCSKGSQAYWSFRQISTSCCLGLSMGCHDECLLIATIV